MNSLTYEELILLDNLIYLKWDIKENEKLINLVDNLLKSDNFDYLMNAIGDCIIRMDTKEWIMILNQIKVKPNLRNLRIKNVNSYNNGMEYACFLSEEGNATVIFRGTATTKEWNDNGKGAYEYDTLEQIEALKYINSLEYSDITVTGHSKGGNKAQYVSIFSPKVSKCVSINGQGFSKEFISRYEEEISKNKEKIISINAKYDYVNCLFNSISEKNIYIKTEIQINPFDYHKASVLLDENGNLRDETNEAEFSKIINYFSSSIISNLPDNLRYLVIDGIVNVIELILCRTDGKDNLFKSLGEYLIMFCHDDCSNYKEFFSIGYAVSEILILPLLFWKDFVIIEESNSKELLNNVVVRMKLLESMAVKKLQIIDKSQIELIQSMSSSVDELIYRIENEI